VVGAGSIHPDTNTEYEVINDVPIAEIDKEKLFECLTDYIPADSTKNGAYTEIVERYGDPYYLTDNGKLLGINESFWAGLHNTEHIQLYEPNERKFYRYDDSTGLYKEITADVIKQEISRRILDVSREDNINDLERKRNNTTLNNIIGQLKGICEKQDAFNNKKNIVHLANCVLEFKDNGDADLVNFSPEFYSRNQSPILFNETAQCPRFLNELLYPATSQEDATLIQKYMGVCLLGNNLIQRFLILDGKAGRGKTQLSLIIQRLVGLNNVTELRTKHLAERFELYRYLKRTLLVGADVPGNFMSQGGANVIKALVGGDMLDAEQKGGTGSFQIHGNYCIVITSNSRLQVKLDGDVGAWRRRLLIVRFEGPPPKKKIDKFADLLIKEEGSGILNLGLHGLRIVLDDIKKYGDIQLSGAQSGVVDALLAESDSLRHFLSDCVVRDKNSDLSVSEIEEAYADYCPEKNWNAKPITIIRKELEGLMLELFATSKSNSIPREGKSIRGFRRVKLKSK
jgi:phage/plasmid-associated DNA primase